MRGLYFLPVLLLSNLSLIAQNVGIGTSDPDSKLEIEHNSTIAVPQLHLHEIGNDQARIKFDNTNGSNAWTIGGYIGSNPRSDRLNFLNGDIELLSMTGEGRLGLAVGTAPKTDFHVGADQRVLFGKDTSGSGDKLMFLPDLHAFRVGTLGLGSRATYWNRDSIGLYSFASGRDTRATGFGATAMGRDTEATDFYAFASGYFTNADGRYSTAMGFNTDAFGEGSTALGYECDAEKAYSFAAGHRTEAQAEGSVALGYFTKAQSFRSTAIGSRNVGGGSAVVWNFDDPIFEIGIGLSASNTKNALTVLKNGKHGILTTSPMANLHVTDDGVLGKRTIVTVLESDISDRPVLQFSETSVGDDDSGMAIEYDGRGSGGDNKMHISKTGGSPAVTFENSGQVGLGVSSPSFALHLPNNSTTGLARAHTWSTYSDSRIKSKIRTLAYGLSEILLLRPVSYLHHQAEFSNSKLILSENHTTTQGFLAQEVHKIIPEAVSKPENEDEQLWGMDYDKLIPVLVKGMQEQQEQIYKLSQEITHLKALHSTESVAGENTHASSE